MGNELRTFENSQLAAEACGQAIFDHVIAARVLRGIATVAVSGGSTPKIMFEWMAQQPFDWKDVHIFWVDERCVPPEDPQSNYRMTNMSLLRMAKIPEDQVHRILGEIEPEQASQQYSRELRRVFSLGEDQLPEFDVIQRGMGPDGHTASLFPGEPAIRNTTELTAALWVKKMNQHRVTLLPGVLEQARVTLNLVTGTDKAHALHSVLSGPSDSMAFPAQISSPQMIWFLDPAAITELEKK